jgi:ubiquinone/menaquinone biosynthesis C-methylase UbiE
MNLFTRPWQTFFDERMRRMVTGSSRMLDIGAGLRLSKEYGNREDATHFWIRDLIQKEKIDYVVLDYVDTYHPHIVGDIQDLPLKDNSEEAIVCLAILEHVENPFKSFAELYRVLKPGGTCLLYVPFLYYYHAERGYYQDYWRFTRDSLEALTKPFSTVELQNVRGPFETLVRLSPLGRWDFSCDIAFLIDRACGKLSSQQTSGYYVWLVK